MKCSRLILLLLLVCLLFAGTAAFADSFSLTVQPADQDPSGVSPVAVEAYKKGDTYWLFLPAGMDSSSLRVSFSGAKYLTVDGQNLQNGDVTDLFAPGSTLSLEYGGKGTMRVSVRRSENLNALFLTTESGNLKKIEKKKGNQEPGTLTVLDNEGRMGETLPLTHLKSRGNATFEYRKKPFQIKLEKKTDLFGMGKAKKWILLANYTDYSLIRNRIAYDIALEVGLAYSCRSIFVDLYINHEYHGNYLLCEKVEIGKNRVEIDELEDLTQMVNDRPLKEYPSFGRSGYKAKTRKGVQIPNDPEDITGGYLVQAELTYRYRLDPSGVVTEAGQPFIIKSPEYATQAQVNYIGDLLQELEDALFSKDGVNPNTGKHYSEYVDKDSYVTLCLLEEVMKNYDANRSSLYFYKPADEQSTLLYAGPAWDFDASLDNYGYIGPKVTTAINSSTKYHWFPHAYRIPDFRERLEALYAERFVPCLAILLGEAEPGTCLRSVRAYADEIAASAEMNYIRWGYQTTTERFTKTGKNFDDSVSRLITFLEKRREFLNEQWLH